jgi:subtilase family serine protease
MNIAKWGRFALALVVGMGAASAASASEPVERSGNSFHVAVCARNVGQGEARCFAHVVTDAAGNPRLGKSPTATPNATPSGYGPAALRSAYSLPVLGTTAPGAGGTIVIVDAYGYTNAESDLAVYRSTFGLGACTTTNGCFRKVNQTGGSNTPRADTGWSQESALDLDMASAMCPDCKLVLVEASTASLANLAAAVQYGASLRPIAISNSYGGGETGSQNYNSSYNVPGVAVTVSSGDSGYGTQFPASSPYVIAVGGTHLTNVASGGRSWTETIWTSAGSGCSAIYGKPAYQTDLSCATRMEADISAVADPNTGVAVYGPVNRQSSGWQVYGGTSVSAPLIAGMFGLAGHGPANVAQKFYPSATNTPSLYDVTVVGSNGSCGGTYFCTTGPGYDGPTGNGTPNGLTSF